MRIKWSRIDAFCAQKQEFLNFKLDAVFPLTLVRSHIYKLSINLRDCCIMSVTHSSGQADPAQGARMTPPYIHPPPHNSFFLPHFLVFFPLLCSRSLFFHRKAQHHQTQVSMAWPLPHFSEPAKGFTWYLLSRFHLGSVTKQKHRQDEKETVSQGPEWDLEELDGGWTLRCYHTPPPSSPLLIFSFLSNITWFVL